MLTPSTPLALTWLTVSVIVVAACSRAAHMCGVPALKSCMMIVTTTLTPCEWAVASSPVSWLEFHTAAPESAAKAPSSRTWRPKKATVDSREKSQLGYPYVRSARLLASANPKTSRCGPPAPPPIAGSFGGAVNGFSEPVWAVATWAAACCITQGCVASGMGTLGVAGAALTGANPKIEPRSRSAGTKYLILCKDIGRSAEPPTLHGGSGGGQTNPRGDRTRRRGPARPPEGLPREG